MTKTAEQRERTRAYQREWYARQRNEVISRSGRRRRKLLGWSDERVEEFRRIQNNGCAICGDVCEMHADHDHATSRPRDLLCGRCNRALGSFKDSPDLLGAAIAYLLKWRNEPV